MRSADLSVGSRSSGAAVEGFMPMQIKGRFPRVPSMYLYSSGTGGRGMNSIGFYTYWIHVQVASGGRMDLYAYSSAFGMILTFMTLPVVLIGGGFRGILRSKNYEK